VKVRFTPRASLRAEKSNKWWRENRPLAPDLFAIELGEAVTRLRTIPGIGTPHPTARRPHLKRLLLAGTGCHVYFEVDEKKDESRILMLWGAPRGKEPKL
jgi:plasmid stabilization system protein ParE